MVAKVSGGSREGSVADDTPHHGGASVKSAHKRVPNGHMRGAHREYSPPLSPLLESSTAYASRSSTPLAQWPSLCALT